MSDSKKELILLRNMASIVGDLMDSADVTEEPNPEDPSRMIKTVVLKQETLAILWESDKEYLEFLDQGAQVQ